MSQEIGSVSSVDGEGAHPSGVGYLAWGRGIYDQDEPQGLEAALDNAPEPVDMVRSDKQVERLKIEVDNDPYLGPEQAPVTIIEFSDFECSYCVRFYRDTLAPLLQEYPNDIKFVYLDFPLTSIHPNAKPAAEAAQCAFAQEKFWEFHNRLFDNQTMLSDALYLEIASDIGLDMAAFDRCYRSSVFTEEIADDFESGRSLGVTGTPTFFINGRPLVGAQPFRVFKAVIEEELATIRQ